MFDNSTQSSYELPTLQKHVVRTYAWMGLGLLVTTIVSFLMNVTNLTLYLYLHVPMFSFILLIAQLGVAISLSARLTKMQPTTTKILFLVYSAITGITFSTLTYQFALSSIVLAFGITTIYFICLVFIGNTIKKDLTSVGIICYTGLIVLVVVELIMMLMGMNIVTKVLTAISLIIFTGITAYDAQKMKNLYYSYEYDHEMLSKLSIYSAFDLYLDFINIFLYILRFVGNNDD